jgi:hypothetical protein
MNDLLLESLSEKVAGDLAGFIDDVVAVLFERDPARFLKAHYVAVNGTEKSFIAFEFDRERFQIAFDLELRAALRAFGLELPRRDDIVVSHEIASSR